MHRHGPTQILIPRRPFYRTIIRKPHLLQMRPWPPENLEHLPLHAHPEASLLLAPSRNSGCNEQPRSTHLPLILMALPAYLHLQWTQPLWPQLIHDRANTMLEGALL